MLESLVASSSDAPSSPCSFWQEPQVRNAISLCSSIMEPVSSISHGPTREQIPFCGHLCVTEACQHPQWWTVYSPPEGYSESVTVPVSESYSLRGEIPSDFGSAYLVLRLKKPTVVGIRVHLRVGSRQLGSGIQDSKNASHQFSSAAANSNHCRARQLCSKVQVTRLP